LGQIIGGKLRSLSALLIPAKSTLSGCVSIKQQKSPIKTHPIKNTPQNQSTKKNLLRNICKKT
jgi:hypothetical protein